VVLDPTESQLWRLPLEDTGTGTAVISTHRLYAPWDSGEATWSDRYIDEPWTGPGAENDYLSSAESRVVISSSGSGTSSYVSMGSLVSAVGAWHTFDYFFPWGNPNDGVLYKSSTESIPDLDWAFAQIAHPDDKPPVLSITYADPPLSAFITPLDPNTNYYNSRAPSPDFYQINSISQWRAFGIRPLDDRSDYDLFISSSTDFTSTFVTSSEEAGSVPDFVVINPDVSSTLYPWAIQWEGTGLYYVRYPNTQGLPILDPGGTTVINDTAFTYTVLSIYQVNLTTGQDYHLSANLTSGNADLGLALFAPTAAGGGSYMTRDDAVALSDATSFGGRETISYSPSVSGQYALVVWNNGGTQTSNYQLRLQSGLLSVYLPLAFKAYQPPAPDFANGSFETGTFSPWSQSGPESPMVASVVANPLSSCFSGNYTARLGTPGKLANGTIPVGEVKVEQTFRVPTTASLLGFKHYVYSYDVIRGSSSGRYYDRFEVRINDIPVYTDGNPAGSSDGNRLWQSGCKATSINLSSYAGQNITLSFSVYNLSYPAYNTWAYFDNVQIK